LNCIHTGDVEMIGRIV